MKLTNILRQINEEEVENGIKSLPKEDVEFAIIPTDMQAALNALDDTKNYGIYSKNLANQAERDIIFGPNRDAQKPRVAQSEWDSYSPKEKFLKIEEIKERIKRFSDKDGNITYDNIGEKSWKRTLDLLSKDKDYAAWVEENGENPEDYLISLNGVEVNKKYKLFGDYSIVFFPQKLGDEEAKYKPLQQDTNFIIKDDKIIFPMKDSPYKGGKYLEKVITLIMDTAGVKFTKPVLTQLDTTPTQEPTLSTEPKSSSTTFKITLDPKKIKANKENSDAIKARISQLKNTYEKNFSYSNNILTINNLPPEKKKDLINFFVPYQLKPINEDFDLERYQMLRRAGIIK
jgi:hypothetical protein